MFLSGPESMEVEKWEEDEEVAMDIDMDDAMVIEMFDNVSSMDWEMEWLMMIGFIFRVVTGHSSLL